MGDETRVPVASDADIVSARQAGRALANRIGFSAADTTLIATAISELARNILEYAKSGEIVLAQIDQAGRVGIRVVASDRGPGIADVSLALRDGYTTGKGLGLGLPGARRMMDEFAIDSATGRGTVVTVTKWLPRHPTR